MSIPDASDYSDIARDLVTNVDSGNVQAARDIMPDSGVPANFVQALKEAIAEHINTENEPDMYRRVSEKIKLYEKIIECLLSPEMPDNKFYIIAAKALQGTLNQSRGIQRRLPAHAAGGAMHYGL